MLFGREYMPEGAGISLDTPRRKGAARLWEILSRDLDGIFLSGALALLACVPAAVLVGMALWLGSLPLCLLVAAVIPRCAFIFLLTGLWLPNLLAMLAVYVPIEKSLHLEEQIHAKREND